MRKLLTLEIQMKIRVTISQQKLCTGITQPDYEYNSEIGMLKLKFERFADRVSNKLTDLSDEVRSIKESKPYSIVVLEGVINELKYEKAELFKDNELLKQEN